MEFARKNLLELRKLTLEELEIYYMELRKYNYYKGEDIKGIELRKKISKLFVSLIKLDRILSGRKINIIGDKRIKNDKPKIYTVTHIGRYDIETGIEVINDSNFLLMGDPGEVYRNFEGLLLYLKGIIFVETNDKEDRNISFENCKKILNQGGNIFMFPEGAWNITENEVVMKLYNGAVRMSRDTGADIVPIAIEQYGNSYFANVGENVNYSIYDKSISNRNLSDDLRDRLCTLKYEIWENKGITKRCDLEDDFSTIYLNSIMKDTENGYTVDEINRTKYNDSSITSPDDAFSYIKKLC